jgi:hypothetical protein
VLESVEVYTPKMLWRSSNKKALPADVAQLSKSQKSRPFYQQLRQGSGSIHRSLSSLAKAAITTVAPKKTHRKTKVIFNWPMPRQEWVDGKYVEHHEKNDESWVELFIDLIYVVLLSSLSNQLEIGVISVMLFFKITLSFWIMCLTRQAIDEYSNRFYCHDFVQKCVYFVYTIAVLIQATAIQLDTLREASLTGGGEVYTPHGSTLSSHQYLTQLSTFMMDTLQMRSLQGEGLGPGPGPTHLYKTEIGSHNVVYSSCFALSLLITRMCLLFCKFSL